MIEVLEGLETTIESIDAQILAAAQVPSFEISIVVPHPGPNRSVPSIVSEITRHFQHRGFLINYDGFRGTLRINWDFPNLTWMEQRDTPRSKPSMIPNLGIGFRAGFVYLCMTNGVSLIHWSDHSLMMHLEREMKKKAALGLKSQPFPYEFKLVPTDVILKLFDGTISGLQSSGYTISESVDGLIVEWGDTLNLFGYTGQETNFDLSD